MLAHGPVLCCLLLLHHCSPCRSCRSLLVPCLWLGHGSTVLWGHGVRVIVVQVLVDHARGRLWRMHMRLLLLLLLLVLLVVSEVRGAGVLDVMVQTTIQVRLVRLHVVHRQLVMMMRRRWWRRGQLRHRSPNRQVMPVLVQRSIRMAVMIFVRTVVVLQGTWD